LIIHCVAHNLAVPSVHIFSNINHTESYEQDSFYMCLNFSSFEKFCLAIYCKIG
jgi:hypothetical protein